MEKPDVPSFLTSPKFFFIFREELLFAACFDAVAQQSVGECAFVPLLSPTAVATLTHSKDIPFSFDAQCDSHSVSFLIKLVAENDSFRLFSSNHVLQSRELAHDLVRSDSVCVCQVSDKTV